MDTRQEALLRAGKAVQTADGLLVTAGAGMGVDSGLPDFRGQHGFWRAYPVIARLGISFAQMANPGWFTRDPRLAWAFYGHRLQLYRQTRPHAGFVRLLTMGKGLSQGGFVLTSNVDGQFQMAGWDEEGIEECHGSIHFLQCTRPCSPAIWSAESFEITIDPESFRALGELPTCPQCGVLARPNILMFGDGSWLEWRTERQSERLQGWLASLKQAQGRLVIIEIGAGYAVPTIRQRSEYYAHALQATLVRINPRESEVPHGRHVGLPMSAAEAIAAIEQVVQEGELS